MKIVILKRDKIGDLLLATPMLTHLRNSMPQAEIHMLANDYNAWVLAGNRDVDRLWVYPRARDGGRLRPLAAVRQFTQLLRLRAQGFDFAIAAGGVASPRAVARIAMLGAKRTVGFTGGDVSNPAFARLSDPVAGYAGIHEVDANLHLLLPLGIAPTGAAPYPTFTPPPVWQVEAAGWLSSNGIMPGRYVIIGLGARRASKQPSKDQVLRWSRHFATTRGWRTVFMWTPGASDNPAYPGDDAIAQPVLDAASADIVPFRGALKPAVGLVYQAAFSIFPDSGLMHLAAASPGGVLGLFAEPETSPHPDQWGPRGPRAGHLLAPQAVSNLDDEAIYAAVGRLHQPGTPLAIAYN